MPPRPRLRPPPLTTWAPPPPPPPAPFGIPARRAVRHAQRASSHGPTGAAAHPQPCRIKAPLAQVTAAAQFRQPVHVRCSSSESLPQQPIAAARPPMRCSRTAMRRAIGASCRACLQTTSLIVPLTARSEEEVHAITLPPRRGSDATKTSNSTVHNTSKIRVIIPVKYE